MTGWRTNMSYNTYTSLLSIKKHFASFGPIANDLHAGSKNQLLFRRCSRRAWLAASLLNSVCSFENIFG